MPNFRASLLDPITGLSTIDTNATCTGLSFTDTSNYDANDEDGHARSEFTDYRRVVITTGDGSTYIMSSIAGDDVDEIIGTASSTNDTINFNFRDDIDIDGLWDIRICNYPTWNNSVAYDDNDIVFYNGALYQCVVVGSTVGGFPDVEVTEWELYEPTAEEELLTRYCTCGKIAVLCINLLKCKEALVHEAFCLISNDFCNDDILCKNKKFLNATKMHILMEAMQFSVNRRAWTEVEDQFNLMKTICNCR